MKYIFLFYIIVSITSCQVSYNKTEKHFWLCGSGCSIGDALYINKDNLRNDTIFNNNVPVATIINVEYRFLADTKTTIKLLNCGEEGTYYEK